jgi:hypothetical protein
MLHSTFLTCSASTCDSRMFTFTDIMIRNLFQLHDKEKAAKVRDPSVCYILSHSVPSFKFPLLTRSTKTRERHRIMQTDEQITFMVFIYPLASEWSAKSLCPFFSLKIINSASPTRKSHNHLSATRARTWCHFYHQLKQAYPQ